MPHGPACADATTLGCTCDCGGRLHGTQPGQTNLREGESQIIGDVPKSSRREKKQLWTEWGLTEKQWNYHHPGETQTLGDSITDAVKSYGKDNVDLSDWVEVRGYGSLPHVWVDDGENDADKDDPKDKIFGAITWDPYGESRGDEPASRMSEETAIDEIKLTQTDPGLWGSKSNLAESKKQLKRDYPNEWKKVYGKDKRPELLYHDGYTFSEKNANETALKEHDVLWFDLTGNQKKEVIAKMKSKNQAKETRKNPDDEDRIPIQTAGGRADTRYNRAYEEAPSHGIFDPESKAKFASRKSRTLGREDALYKRNVRAWVSAAKDAISSGNEYRIAETARETPYTPPGSEGIVEHLGVSQHLAQANVAGQHMEQSLGLGKPKDYEEHKGEFKAIVDTIDVQTKDW